MPSIDAKTILTLLGLLFLALGCWRAIRAGGLPLQARIWLLMGLFFNAIAAWLRWGAPGSV